MLTNYKVSLNQTVILLICVNLPRHKAFWIIILPQRFIFHLFILFAYKFSHNKQVTVKQIIYPLKCLLVHHKILDLFLSLTLTFSVVCGAMITFGWWENAHALLGTWMSTKTESWTLYSLPVAAKLSCDWWVEYYS